MKKRLNLLRKQKKYQQVEKIMGQFRLSVIFLMVIFFSIISLIFFNLVRERKKISILSSRKKQLLEYMLKNREVEAKFTYFNNKYGQMKKILKKDVNFYPYYSLLNENLKNASLGASLESVKIDSSKETGFTISFSNFGSMISFLKYTESNSFLKNFSQLTLVSFSTEDKNDQGKKQNYYLIFEGKFKKI